MTSPRRNHLGGSRGNSLEKKNDLRSKQLLHSNSLSLSSLLSKTNTQDRTLRKPSEYGTKEDRFYENDAIAVIL